MFKQPDTEKLKAMEKAFSALKEKEAEFEELLALEIVARDRYNEFIQDIKDKELINTIEKIIVDENKHTKMVERMLSLIE